MTRALPTILTPALLAVLLAPAPAAAYEFTGLCEDGESGVAWDYADGPITWRLSSTHPSTQLTDAEVRSAIGGAFAEWDAPACSTVDAQQGAAIAADPFDDGTPELVIGFYEDAWPAALGTGLLALTRIEFDPINCVIRGGDVAVDGADWTWINGSPSGPPEADLQAVMTHEVGHLLGLSHTNVGASVMSFPYPHDLTWRTLGCDDTGGVCALYPSGDASCTDSSYCPCGNPCVDGFCEGLTFEEGGECWELFLPEETVAETEPNDDSANLTPIELTGGDIVIEGSSLACGNDGLSPNEDLDWFDFNVPCTGRLFVTVEPSAFDADLDVVVYDDTNAVGDAMTRDAGATEYLEVEVGEHFQILVYCFEGSPTNWTLRAQFLSPGEIPEIPGGPGPEGCSCGSTFGGREAGGGLALALLLLLSRRGGRERGGPAWPCGGPSRRGRSET